MPNDSRASRERTARWRTPAARRRSYAWSFSRTGRPESVLLSAESGVNSADKESYKSVWCCSPSASREVPETAIPWTLFQILS